MGRIDMRPMTIKTACEKKTIVTKALLAVPPFVMRQFQIAPQQIDQQKNAGDYTREDQHQYRARTAAIALAKKEIGKPQEYQGVCKK
jgi:hypothetical protein